ncbi:hypothetical protein B0H12DRAFT_1236912 [Mycena haematopus]|nr:hypothetical protein B0H12DRAFT_1236912 [Mycena haematopus]
MIKLTDSRHNPVVLQIYYPTCCLTGLQAASQFLSLHDLHHDYHDHHGPHHRGPDLHEAEAEAEAAEIEGERTAVEEERTAVVVVADVVGREVVGVDTAAQAVRDEAEADVVEEAEAVGRVVDGLDNHERRECHVFYSYPGIGVPVAQIVRRRDNNSCT